MDPLSIVASIIAVVGAVATSSNAIQHLKGLPKEFRDVNQILPLVHDTLCLARDRLRADGTTLDATSKSAIEPVLSGCEAKAKILQDIFDAVEKGTKDGDGSAFDLYRTALLRLGKAHRVEALMQGIVKSLYILATNQFFRSSIQRGKLVDAEDMLLCVESSVPDSEFESAGIVQNVGTGATGNLTSVTGQGNNVNSGSGRQYIAQNQTFGTD